MEKLQYRQDIDGLRGIAVLLVVGFHFFPSYGAGGFIGVDVFFVISGYLISKIILHDLQARQFSFWQFYQRRIRRLFPALIAVLAGCYAMGWYVLLPDEFRQLGRHIAAAALFLSNFVFWKETGYFDNAPAAKPLLHLWSLGVEEQFYLLWPLILWGVWKARLNILGVIVTLIAVSFLLSLQTLTKYQMAAFYLPHARFWEILSGAALASVYPREVTSSRIAVNVMSLAGALLVAAGVLVTHPQSLFPGFYVVLPIAGTLMMIAAGSRCYLNKYLLSNRMLVWVGIISYPLYLWHWSIFSFVWIVQGGAIATSLRIKLVLMSFVLAWLTYVFVEKPLHSGGQYRISVTIALLVALGAMGWLGHYTYRERGLSFRLGAMEDLVILKEEWGYPGGMTAFRYDNRMLYKHSSQRSTYTLFAGDSNAQQYYPRIKELIEVAPQDNNGVVFVTDGYCIPVPATENVLSFKYCEGLMETALKYALSHDEVTNVVIVGRWGVYLIDSGGLKEKIGYGTDRYWQTMNRLRDYISALTSQGKKVSVVLGIPVGPMLDPRNSIVRSFADFPDMMKPNLQLGRRMRDDEIALDKDLRAVAESAGAEVIDPIAFLCSDGFCSMRDPEGRVIYFDGYHIKPSYVRQYIPYMDKTLH